MYSNYIHKLKRSREKKDDRNLVLKRTYRSNVRVKFIEEERASITYSLDSIVILFKLSNIYLKFLVSPITATVIKTTITITSATTTAISKTATTTTQTTATTDKSIVRETCCQINISSYW